jgi:uncharacterized Tic20 family protein
MPKPIVSYVLVLLLVKYAKTVSSQIVMVTVSFALIIVMLVALSMSIQNKLLQIWQQPA